MKTRCRKCMKLIEFRENYCDRCKEHFVKKKVVKKNIQDVDKYIKTAYWQSLRKQILLRDKCCVLCFKRGFIEVRGLQVHHILKRVDDINGDKIYDPENLVSVCKKCHEELEKLPVSKQKELIGVYNKELYDFRL